MKIMVSACLAGENCKYNGGNNRNEKVLQLMEENEVITVCPEQMGGLPTPRVPSEIRDGVVTAKDGRIVDTEFRAGAVKCLEIARREQPDLIVLQSRSPSCGVKQRYDGTFTGTLVDGAGVTAQLLIENGFRCVDVEDLATIHNGVLIRKLYSKEVGLLKDFLYEAIFIPEGVKPPARDIVEQPELRLYYDDFGQSPADPKSGPCPFFNVGDEFILKRTPQQDDFYHLMNGKFCGEAWDAISRYVYTALQGGSIMKGWTNDDRMMIACCNDGTRPVIFKIERIDIPENDEEAEWLAKQNIRNTAEDAYTG